MVKKTQEKTETEVAEVVETKSTKKAAVKKTTAKKVATEKPVAAKKTATKKEKAVDEKPVATKKAATKKAATKKAVTKKAATKKAATKKVATKKVVAKKVADVADDADEQVPGEKKNRHFKCIYEDVVFGRFSGSKPKQAANKALTSLVKSHNIVDEISFSIIECTRGSKRKTHNYRGKRVKLEEPMVVNVGSGENMKQITYNFNNDLHKLKANEALA
jgi:hypothetical protein